MLSDERYLDLQLFAPDDPAEDDDLSEEDEIDDLEDEFDVEDEDEDETKEDIRAAVGAKEEEKPEEKLEDETKEVPEEKSEEKPTGEKFFTKAEVERIVEERFLRDPSRIAAKNLETMTGMNLPQMAEYIKQQQEKEEVDKLVEEEGMSEERAKTYVQSNRKSKELEGQVQTIAQQQQMYQQQYQYIQDKAKLASDPLIKKYEQEIDAFAQNGAACGFEVAANYILGQKVRDGDLVNAIKSGTVNKTLADLDKQSKVKVEQGSYGGGAAGGEGLDSFTKSMAAKFGVSPKEVKAEQGRIAREKRGGRK